MQQINGDSPSEYKSGRGFFIGHKSELERMIHHPPWLSRHMRSLHILDMAVDNILGLLRASVIVLPYAISSLGWVPSIVVLILSLIITPWLIMSWNHEHFDPLLLIALVMTKFPDDWSMWRKVACIVVLLSFGYRAFGNHSIPLWLINVPEMMLVIHVTCKAVIHVTYNHQISFYFYGSNDGVGPRLEHRVALKSNMGAAAATLANNKGVEILAAAIDSSLTGGVATSAIHSLRLLLDSGATSHAVGDKSILQGYRELTNPRTGILPDGSTVSMIGVGTIQTERFTITNVYHVEGLSVNLISVSQLYRQYGLGVGFIRGRCEVMLEDGTTAGVGVLENDRLYVLTNLHVPAGPVQE